MSTEETKFLARYYHRGSWWTLEFFALDFDDAEAICRAHNLQLDGQHVMSIPAVSGSWLPNLIIRVRNFVRSNREHRRNDGDLSNEKGR